MPGRGADRAQGLAIRHGADRCRDRIRPVASAASALPAPIRSPSVSRARAVGYAGFNGLYENGRPGGALIEAACWAHTRRKFFDVHAKSGSAVALEALERIGSLYELERSTSGKPPDERARQRQARSQPLATALKAWAETILPQLSGASDLAKAFRYMLARWTALMEGGRMMGERRVAQEALFYEFSLERHAD